MIHMQVNHVKIINLVANLHERARQEDLLMLHS